MKEYKVIGLMSGTSLDGVDLAYCRFTLNNGKWSHRIEQTQTIAYPDKWHSVLRNAQDLPTESLDSLHVQLGDYFAHVIEHFIEGHSSEVDFISSHGHTAIHRPAEGLTRQLGSGSRMSHLLGIPVINDFRSKDLRFGGQGAPLVPIGDDLLFADYDICVNLGGFANLSYSENGKRTAFDICPLNMALDEVAHMAGKAFDDHGEMARTGSVSERLLKELNALPYYRSNGPKSLGREWYLESFRPIWKDRMMPMNHLAASLVEHAAIQIAKSMEPVKGMDALFTGGGAYHDFLMERIAHHSNKDLHIPEDSLVQYKEALVFAFLGVLRWRNEVNVLASVTGASQDHCSGVIHRA